MASVSISRTVCRFFLDVRFGDEVLDRQLCFNLSSGKTPLKISPCIDRLPGVPRVAPVSVGGVKIQVRSLHYAASRVCLG